MKMWVLEFQYVEEDCRLELYARKEIAYKVFNHYITKYKNLKDFDMIDGDFISWIDPKNEDYGFYSTIYLYEKEVKIYT